MSNSVLIINHNTRGWKYKLALLLARAFLQNKVAGKMNVKIFKNFFVVGSTSNY